MGFGRRKNDKRGEVVVAPRGAKETVSPNNRSSKCNGAPNPNMHIAGWLIILTGSEEEWTGPLLANMGDWKRKAITGIW
jgi:hypothetical protein